MSARKEVAVLALDYATSSRGSIEIVDFDSLSRFQATASQEEKTQVSMVSAVKLAIKHKGNHLKFALRPILTKQTRPHSDGHS